MKRKLTAQEWGYVCNALRVAKEDAAKASEALSNAPGIARAAAAARGVTPQMLADRVKLYTLAYDAATRHLNSGEVA